MPSKAVRTTNPIVGHKPNRSPASIKTAISAIGTPMKMRRRMTGMLALCGLKPYLKRVLEGPATLGVARVNFTSPNLSAEEIVRNGDAVTEHGRGVK